MAVLPTPMINTRSPIGVDMPKGNRFQPIDANVNAIRVVLVPEYPDSLPRGAPLPTKIASNLVRQAVLSCSAIGVL